jgi:hypothetical protein
MERFNYTSERLTGCFLKGKIKKNMLFFVTKWTAGLSRVISNMDRSVQKAKTVFTHFSKNAGFSKLIITEAGWVIHGK